MLIDHPHTYFNSNTVTIRALPKIVFFAVMLFLTNAGFTQNRTPVIQGKVFVARNMPAELATVILLAADSSIISSTSCNAFGAYKFSVKPGNYLLLASSIGYEQSLSGPYLAAQQDVNVSDIFLIKSVPELKEVSISARRSYIEVKPGRVVLNVQNSIVAEGNSVYDVLRQAPGVQLGNSGEISILGRQSAMILIDGKPTNLTGDNLRTILQSMQSSSVQQIELISNPSAKYDAGGAGVINIILKKGSNEGANGTFNIGFGYGKYYKTTGGLTFNSRKGNVNVFGNYNFSANKSFRTFTTERTVDYNGFISDYDSKYYTTRESFNHTFRLGSDFNISPRQTLGVLVSGTVNKSSYLKDNFLSITNNGVFDSTIVTIADLKRDLSSVNYDVNYVSKLDTLGQTLSADVSYNHFDRESNEYISNFFNKASGVSYRPTLFQQNLSPSKINIWAAKVDYVKPLAKGAQLEMGVKYSNVESDNDLVFGPKVNDVYTIDPTLSSNFVYTEKIGAAYALLNASANKWRFTVGLRAERTMARGASASSAINFENNYTNLFPQATVRFNHNANNNFTLSFNRSITRPAYEDINPFLYFVDLYDYRSGNPKLMPSITSKIELTHLYKSIISTSLYMAVTDNFFNFNSYNQNDENKVNVTTRKNFGRWAVYGIRFLAPVDFTNWWNASFSVDAAYQRIKAYAENGDLNKGIQDIIIANTHTFTITKGFSAEFTALYETPTFYGYANFKANYRFNAGISKSLFNNMGSLKLTGGDIFRTDRDRATIKYQNLNMAIVNREEGRVVRLGFTYRFGNKQLKSSSARGSGNEEEQRRTGSVAGSGN